MVQTDIPYIAIYYLCSWIFTAVGISVGVKYFSKLSDKGFAFYRILGLLIVTYITWLISYTIKIPINLFTILLFSIFIMAYPLLKKRVVIFHEIKNNYKALLLSELVFLISFGLMILYRSSVPKIEGIEKFMDLAIINGLIRTEVMPPEDVWYSGNTINYYYFGHLTLAIYNKLTQIPSAVSYNLNVALIFALTTSASFSLGLNLTRNKFFALLGALVLSIGGNLDYLYKTLFMNSQNYFYAEARSLIPFTINEFPSYSFIISDLHAHIINIPFVLLFLSLITNLYQNKVLAQSKIYLLLIALNVGAFGAINSWDLLIYFPLFTVVYIFSNINKFRFKELLFSLKIPLALGITSVLLLLFFYLDFKPGASGIGIVHDYINALDFMRMFGFFLFNILAYAILLTVKKKIDHTDKLIIILAFYGIFLMLVPNIIFFKDIYYDLNPDYYRANTIFKVWYQTWIIFTVTIPYIFYKYWTELKNKKLALSGIFFTLNVFLLFYIFKYSYVGYKYVIGPEYVYKGLDGSEYLNESNKGDLEVIKWINTQIKGQPTILEKDGQSYSMDSLISAYTGLPTPVGWSEHELGWRKDWTPIAYRMGDIQLLYTSQSIDQVKQLIHKYEIEYVVISSREKNKYGQEAGSILRELSESKITSHDTELLKINIF